MNQLHLSLKSSAFGLVSGSCYVKQSSAIKAMICSYDFFWYDFLHSFERNGPLHQSKYQLAKYAPETKTKWSDFKFG